MESKKTLIFMAMGLELVALILAAVFFGQWLDQNHGWNGLGIVSMSIFALVGWLIHLVQLLKRVAE